LKGSVLEHILAQWEFHVMNRIIQSYFIAESGCLV